MRFYLNVPLVVGYVSMALVATLGMLQFAAARGGYQGLSLFVDLSSPQNRRRGAYLGAGLCAGALLAYVLLAPEILTPGPAGTEVAEMFALCALTSLGISLVGAGLRRKRAQAALYAVEGGQTLDFPPAQACLYPAEPKAEPTNPAVVLLPDPAGLVLAPPALLGRLRQAGLNALALDLRADADKLYHLELLSTLSAAIAHLAGRFGAQNLRVGLLGLGLGGDAVLRAAAVDPQVRACLAVQPLLDGSKFRAGLPRLRELSYFQAWRWGWKRRRAARQKLAADLDGLGALQAPFYGPAGVLVDEGRPLESGSVERLAIPTDRHFSILEEDVALESIVAWFQTHLVEPAAEGAKDVD